MAEDKAKQKEELEKSMQRTRDQIAQLNLQFNQATTQEDRQRITRTLEAFNSDLQNLQERLDGLSS